MLTQLSLCYSIVYHYNAAHWYEQFLHVGRLYWALILLGLAVYLPSTSVSSLHGAIYVKFVFVTFCTLPANELSLVGLGLDLVDYPLSFSAVTLSVRVSDP